MDTHDTELLKRLTIIALVSDDELFNCFVLKGGNAISIAHNLTSRASFDLDFSMEGQFEPAQLATICGRIEFRLRQSFGPAGYAVFDVKFEPKPENISPELQSYWGGYNLEFKLIAQSRFDALQGDLPAIRREAIPLRPGGRARFEIDISRHEYCVGKEQVPIEHFNVFVYTPAMIVCEKIRAICQQMPAYVTIVKKHRAPRARDFFDIYEVTRHFRLDMLHDKNVDLLRNMFNAKRVSLRLLEDVEQEREFHRENWDALRDTVAPQVQLRDFEFYFDFVVHLCQNLARIVD